MDIEVSIDEVSKSNSNIYRIIIGRFFKDEGY